MSNIEKISSILRQYNIFPQAAIPITDRVHKIKANGKQYALKRSKMEESQLERWINVYEMASQHRLLNVLPIYLTQNQKLYVQQDQEIYYLTPWIEKKINLFSQSQLEQFFKQIGNVHLQSKRIHTLHKNQLEKNFQSYKKTCQRGERELFSTVEYCERAHFPSPLQLQILTHFKDVSYALHLSQQLTDRFLTQAESELTWGTSLTHGDLKRSHIFENYIINWEKSHLQHASRDLVSFFYNGAGHYGTENQLLNSFPAYLEENRLESHELFYLALYLLDSDNYLKQINRLYSSGRKKISIAKQTIQLEQFYRRILFGIKFYGKLSDFEPVIPESEHEEMED